MAKGYDRSLTVTTPKDKDYVTQRYWEPNNYTKISRPRKVVAKDGQVVTVDFRNQSDTEKDDIVVRFVPTPDDVVEAMCRMAKVGKDDVVYDLGCGDGRMVITAVKKFDAKKGVGVDLDPELVKKCQGEAAKEDGVADKVEFRVGDVLKVDDLSDATVVLLYMGGHQPAFEADSSENAEAGQPRRVAPLLDGRRLDAGQDREDSEHERTWVTSAISTCGRSRKSKEPTLIDIFVFP